MADQPVREPAPAHVKLPPFWPANPEDWFGLAEAQFHIRRVDDDLTKFYHVVSSLPDQTVKTVSDLIRARPPPEDAYDQIRARLLASHTLTEFQRMEKMQQIRSLHGQRPSEMLADLVQLCPAGETETRLFRIAFLQRLPRDMRMILAEDTATTLPALAARADLLWSHSSIQPHDQAVHAIAGEDEDDGAAIAAVSQQQRGGGRGRGRGRRGFPSRGPATDGNAQHATAAAGPPAPIQLARQSSGLCSSHWKYGEKAYSCKAPCSWQGN
jgi:hypothetical protein